MLLDIVAGDISGKLIADPSLAEAYSAIMDILDAERPVLPVSKRVTKRTI